MGLEVFKLDCLYENDKNIVKFITWRCATVHAPDGEEEEGGHARTGEEEEGA